jgi:hypothetical protein
MKDNAKQNKDKKNNNKHKQDATKGGKILIYGCIHLIIVS